MRNHWIAALAAVVLVFGARSAIGAEASSTPSTTSAVTKGEKGLCIVCQVKDGTTHLEPVAQARTFENARYTFCSKECAAEFDLDPVGFVPPTFPREAPELALTDLGGQAITSETLRGKVTLVDFWATWCAPCRKSMPELQAMHDKYSAKGLTVVGISIDETGPQTVEKVEKFVRSKKIQYPIAIDAEKSPVWERFHVKSVPAAFLLDREGNIVAQWTGRPVDIKELEAKLTGLLAADAGNR